MFFKTQVLIANSLNPEKTPRNSASDPDPSCLTVKQYDSNVSESGGDIVKSVLFCYEKINLEQMRVIAGRKFDHVVWVARRATPAG